MLAVSKHLRQDDCINTKPLSELPLILAGHKHISLLKHDHVSLQDDLDPPAPLPGTPDYPHACCVHDDSTLLLSAVILK